MFFYMPTKVYEEKDCVISRYQELCALGKHALIVTGKKSAFVNGSYDDVCAGLDKGGVAHSVFSDVEENPSVETVMRGREAGLSCGADFVIGVGGGSALDAAKAIALMIKHSGEDESYLYKKGADSACLPMAAVPTTCGTGSEVTGVSVLTLHQKKTKGSIAHKIFPALALTDAKYLAHAPQSVIRNTAIDALAHLYESHLNSQATDYSRMCVSAGLDTWRFSKDALLDESQPGEKEASCLMRASTFAGMAIAHTGTSLPHGLSYTVTYALGMPHGKAAGYFLAGYLSEAEKTERDYLLEKSGFSSLQEFKDFYDKVCGAEKIPADILETAVESVAGNKAKLESAPFKTDRDVLYRIANF